MDFFNQEEKCFELDVNDYGLNFHVAVAEFDQLESGEGSEALLRQYVCLKMLEEEGFAEVFRNGFSICEEFAIHLDEDARRFLRLPETFSGDFRTRIRGQADQSNFQVDLTLEMPDGQSLSHYEIEGPFLVLGVSERYFLTPAEYAALTAIKRHQSIAKKTEQFNLRLIAELQGAKREGMRIDLAHFNNLNVVEPQGVKLAVEQMENGDLLLTPNFGDDIDPSLIRARLGQLKEGDTVGSLRVGDRRLSLDEQCVKATKEIIRNQRIGKDQVKTFLKSPTAFINASLVDLDEGFSLRVRGVTEFEQHYFGDTDESGIEWFGPEQSDKSSEKTFNLGEFIHSQEELESFEEAFEDAIKKGVGVLKFKNHEIDISDTVSIDRSISSLANKFNDTSGSGQGNTDENKTGTGVIDIETNDEELGFGGDTNIESMLFKKELCTSNIALEPFDYQEVGIRWILGHAQQTDSIATADLGKYGALLADDMGLGKTFMSLAAVSHYQSLSLKRGQTERPVLVVAPLTLLENWKDEVSKSFIDWKQVFDEIITLQTKADLPRFKVGSGTETRQPVEATLADIRYSLKVGRRFASQRLDMPRRLVLTTYQTLRDYQFSLARIDWSFVIFDEAQQIKNPNTLASHAAKALKARFKLIATGTPVENSLKDFWNLMDTAVPGRLDKYQAFNKKYIKPILSADESSQSEIRQKIGRQLRDDVGTLMLRRVKEDELSGLPKKTIYVGDDKCQASKAMEYLPSLKCLMGERQREAYEAVIDVFRTEDNDEANGSSVLAGLKRLRDVSLHPALLEGGTLPLPVSKQEAITWAEESGKLKQIFQLFGEIQKRGEKVIIFCINKRLQAFVSRACELVFDIRVPIINGDTKAIENSKGAETRKSLIKSFESAPGFGVIVMSPIAAGMGLTVVGANNVIHLERHWNPAKEAQATDRVFRIGQKRDVNVYIPILHHPDAAVTTFDENLNILLARKTALGDAVVTPEQISPFDFQQDVFGFDTSQARPSVIRESDLSTLDWKSFEAFCAELLGKSFALNSQLTKDGSDKGADVVLLGKENILVQCKHTASNISPTIASVREIFSARPLYEQAMNKTFSRMMVISNATRFSTEVKKAAKASKVELLSLKNIKKILNRHDVSRGELLRRLDKERLAI